MNVELIDLDSPTYGKHFDGTSIIFAGMKPIHLTESDSWQLEYLLKYNNQKLRKIKDSQSNEEKKKNGKNNNNK